MTSKKQSTPMTQNTMKLLVSSVLCLFLTSCSNMSLKEPMDPQEPDKKQDYQPREIYREELLEGTHHPHHLHPQSSMRKKSLLQNAQNQPTPTPLPQDVQVVETDKLERLKLFAGECSRFADLCRTRVEHLEAYRKEADKVIETQAHQVTLAEDEARSEKRKRNILLPIAGIAIGLLTGIFIPL